MEIKLHVVSNAGYTLREDEINGVAHWVVPVVMMLEGVHNGSHGPLFYPAEELARFPEAWNGIPAVINHPQDDGQNVSANSPEVVEAEAIGRIYNTYMEADKLKAEVWIEVARINELSAEAAEAIREGRPMDVSVGVFTDEEELTGDWHGEEYVAVARNYRPDHLALLPNAQGACSWDDGCGIRSNTKKGGNMKHETVDIKAMWAAETLPYGYGPTGTVTINLEGSDVADNETGFNEISGNIQRKLDSLDNGMRIHFLEELFEDHFIYRVHNREGNDTEFFKRTYTVLEDGNVDFGDDPVKVSKNVSYDVVSTAMRRNKFSSNKNKKSMTENANGSPCKVTALIENEATKFVEEDRKFLEGLSDEQLDKLVPNEVAAVVEIKEEGTPPEITEVVNQEKEKPELTADQVKAVLSNQEDPEKFIEDFMPAGMQDQMKSGLKLFNEKRTTLIKGIVDNSKFTEDELKDYETATLEKLHDSVVPAADYSALGTNVRTNGSADDEDMKSMLNIKEEK